MCSSVANGAVSRWVCLSVSRWLRWVRGAPGRGRRVVLASAVSTDLLLDPALASVQGGTGESDDVDMVHHRGRLGQFLGGGGP